MEWFNLKSHRVYCIDQDSYNLRFTWFISKLVNWGIYLCHLFCVDAVDFAISASSFNCRWRIAFDSRATKLFNALARFYRKKINKDACETKTGDWLRAHYLQLFYSLMNASHLFFDHMQTVRVFLHIGELKWYRTMDGGVSKILCNPDWVKSDLPFVDNPYGFL